MYVKKILIGVFVFISFAISGIGQCNQSLTINSFDSECNGDGTSDVTINVTVLFGNGNNSATLSYDLGAGSVVAVVLEDDDGDIINQTYMFTVPSCDNYDVILTAWTNPSGSGSSCSDPAPITVPIVLPVEFGALNLRLRGDLVDISWSTYSEINNDKFEIQKSRNSEEFFTIGIVSGNINSHELRNYRFQDKLSISGRYYYRIKQVDLDGQYSFSDMKEVNYIEKYNTTISPNPASNFISISSSTNKYFDIYRTDGILIKELEFIDNKIEVDISDIRSGVYYLISRDKAEVKKFIKY